MSLEERRAWIRLVVAVIAYGVYVAVVAAGAPYGPALLWSVGGAIAAGILGEILLGGRSREIDERDREIGRAGDHIGQSLLVVGALAGMLMAIAGWDHFWIANAIYLGFVLSAVLGGVAKAILYRTGMPW
ncbi:hypothetical protein [Catenuloplanes atrovinosus]|uniref:Membrane-anchored protein n=1 Tax=Catenuloplanes atrovinosus TaxID=137266 RepID=A0AAE3YL13_9ACTN|nr:hypothetical protein [Catenuloplanes atrovinosus]MDR7274472.1 putative membrane-anchored protein [Catenuloplanes atrovinosus]